MSVPRTIQIAMFVLAMAVAGAPCAGDQFIRSDANGDGSADISDAVFTLLALFSGEGIALSCEDSSDSNDDGGVDVSDAIFTLSFLFTGGPAPRAPFPGPGCDLTTDSLTCGAPDGTPPCEPSSALIIDHTYTDLTGISTASVNTAKSRFKIWYGHTSHGSQILSGIEAMRSALYDYNRGAGTLSIVETGGDLGNPDYVTWSLKTRTQLQGLTNDRNVVMWSWCGQASGISEDDLQEYYLENMAALEAEFPGVMFIYMTGHLDGSGVAGNLNQRNEQIRRFCRTNGKILFDFADIESYDPDGNCYLDKSANDNCDYRDGGTTRNWAIEWCDRNPGKCSICSCAHSQSLNCDRKARAFWWMMALLAERAGQ